MALWPNGRYMTCSTYKGYGVAPGLDASIKANGDRSNRFLALNKTASTPDGYGIKTFIPPVRAGSMAALKSVSSLDGSADMLQGGPMEGAALVAEMTGTSGLSLVVGLEGNTAVVTLTGNNMLLRLTVGLNGEGSFSLTGTNNLAMIVPFEGAGSVVTMGVGATDLRGLLSMQGEWTPFTELSPEGLANAVWSSLVSQYQVDGTMGKALGTASSGGVDLNLMAQAVWEYVSRTLTAGGGTAPTAEEVADAVLAAAQATPIKADIQTVRNQALKGTGTTSDPWNPV